MPAFAPAVVVAGVVVYIAMRDRREAETSLTVTEQARPSQDEYTVDQDDSS